MENQVETTNAPATEEVVATPVNTNIQPLGEHAKLKDVIAAVNALIEKSNKPTRDRGPSSLRDMTEDDARKILIGELKETPHTKAAEILGLSYGQVYSARKGFTFKTVYKEANKRS